MNESGKDLEEWLTMHPNLKKLCSCIKNLELPKIISRGQSTIFAFLLLIKFNYDDWYTDVFIKKSFDIEYVI